MTNSKKLYLYGSLRLNQYNYEHFIRIFGKENFQHIKTDKISGWDLYSLGSYPTVIKGSNHLTVDVFNVSKEVYENIKSMELGAGYHEHTLDDGGIIYYREYPPSNKSKIEHGDWSKYLIEYE